MKIYKSFIFALAMGLAPLLTACDEMGKDDNPVSPAEPVKEVHISGISLQAEGLVNNELTLVIGTSLQLTADITPVDTKELDVLWSTSSSGILSISETGLVTAKRSGDVTVTVKSKANKDIKSTITVHVVTEPIEGLTIVRYDGIAIDNRELALYVGEEVTLYKHIFPEGSKDYDVIWTSSDAGIAHVAEFGHLRGVKAGDAVITCTSAIDEKVKDTLTVHVVDPIIHIEGVAIKVNGAEATEASVIAGEILQLTADLQPVGTDERDVIWTSANEDVAEVTGNGLVIGKKVGDVVITLTSAIREDLKASITIHVKEVPISGLDIFGPEQISLFEGEAWQLDVEVSPSDTEQTGVAWSSSDNSVATVSADGNVTAVKAGTAVITVTSTVDPSIKASVTVVVKSVISGLKISATGMVGGEATLLTGETLQLKAEVVPSDTEQKDVIWRSADESIAVVSSNGLVTALNAGDVVITVTSAVNPSIKATATIHVQKPITDIEITGAKAKLVPGNTLQLGAIITPTDTPETDVTWTSDNTSVATVSADGLVTAIKKGTVKITVCSAIRTGVSDNITIEVLEGAVDIDSDAVAPGKAESRR